MALLDIRTIDATSFDQSELSKSLLRRKLDISPEIELQVKDILGKVKERGDEALCEFTRRFDCPDFDLEDLKVSQDEIEKAFGQVDPRVLSSLEKAKTNIEDFHKRQLPGSWFETREDGTILGQMVRPVGAAGLYVPGGTGGKTPLVSSVLMNAIPARIAGVERIVLCTPPGEGANISPYLLVAARLSGVTEIFRVGSAWAIGAMAYGTDTIKKVDVIAGPGNIFVTVAKKVISGTTGIDMIAGPSEILIIADDSADPEFVAADMLSQAEHDTMATSILVTSSRFLMEKVKISLEKQLSMLPRADIARESINKNGLMIYVKDLEVASDVANEIAPEHLELFVENPWELLTRIKNAGAIFLGKFSPEPIGDYIAGPNHVLPTMGTARFSSALGVETFLKRSSIIYYSRDAFLKDAKDVMSIAEVEGLIAHKNSIKVRL